MTRNHVGAPPPKWNSAHFFINIFRARSTVERSFGQMVHRFKLLNGTLNFTRRRCTRFILAGVLLHNFLRERELEEDLEPPDVDLPTDEEYEARRRRAPMPNNAARIYRERFVEYFDMGN
jgi:hypothetical protein